MDDAGHASSPNDGTHLWIPEPEARDCASDPVPSSSRAPQLLKDRLYVGNLSPTVDEYTLLQVFTKFGKVAKLDFLFHKSGINKGKPRGYAFVEFMNEADASKALHTANGKLLRGRKLVVTFAQQAPSYDSSSNPYSRNRRSDTTPTALSLVKSSGIARPEAKTSSKIAMMEAKLRQMASSSPFGERPALPSKPVSTRWDAVQGTQSQRAPRSISATERIHERSTVVHAESSDTTRPYSKQRIPGVKIVKGAK